MAQCKQCVTSFFSLQSGCTAPEGNTHIHGQEWCDTQDWGGVVGKNGGHRNTHPRCVRRGMYVRGRFWGGGGGGGGGGGV